MRMCGKCKEELTEEDRWINITVIGLDSPHVMLCVECASRLLTTLINDNPPSLNKKLYSEFLAK